jgi:hypothetical protein
MKVGEQDVDDGRWVRARNQVAKITTSPEPGDPMPVLST